MRKLLEEIDKDAYNIEWETSVYTNVVGSSSCWAFIGGCGIRVDGGVSACPETPAIANVFEIPLADIFRTEYFKRCRRYLSEIEEPCKSCVDLHICGGGCRSKAHSIDNDEFAMDPYCPLYTKR